MISVLETTVISNGSYMISCLAGFNIPPSWPFGLNLRKLVLQRVDPLRAKFKIFLVKCIFNGIDLGRVTLNYDTTIFEKFSSIWSPIHKAIFFQTR